MIFRTIYILLVLGAVVLVNNLFGYDLEILKEKILPEKEMVEVDIYFNNKEEDPFLFDCSRVWPVARKVNSHTEIFGLKINRRKVEDIAQSAIEKLLKGPTSEEKEGGYVSGIPDKEEIRRYKEIIIGGGHKSPFKGDEIKLLSLKIEDGIAFIDFSKELASYGGGSCKTAAIRSQIDKTLKQFKEIKKVVISIKGQVEEALQP